MSFAFTRPADINGFLVKELGNWSASSFRIHADRFENHHGWTFYSPLTLEVKDLVNHGELTTTQNMVVRAATITQGAKGALRAHGALDVEATGLIDNSWGKMQGHDRVRVKGGTVKVGDKGPQSGHHYARNGALISSDGDLELEGVSGIELNFGEVAARGKGYIKSQGRLLLNSALMRIGGETRFQVQDILAKMNDLTEVKMNVCDPKYWHKQWRTHISGDPSYMQFGGDVYLELASKALGNFTLIASHFAAMGNVYDHEGMGRTVGSLGTFTLAHVVPWEYAEKHTGPGGPHNKKSTGGEDTVHATFSASGEVDLNFAAYLLGAAKLAAAAVNLPWFTCLMIGAGKRFYALWWCVHPKLRMGPCWARERSSSPMMAA